MKKILGFLVVMLCMSTRTLAQDCDPMITDPSDPFYCVPIPVDDSIVFLIVAGLGFGLWKLRNSDQFAIEPQ